MNYRVYCLEIGDTLLIVQDPITQNFMSSYAWTILILNGNLKIVKKYSHRTSMEKFPKRRKNESTSDYTILFYRSFLFHTNLPYRESNLQKKAHRTKSCIIGIRSLPPYNLYKFSTGRLMGIFLPIFHVSFELSWVQVIRWHNVLRWIGT